jgi:hypothetical protein
MSKRTNKVLSNKAAARKAKPIASAAVRLVALPKSDDVAKAIRSDAAQEMVDGVISRGKLAIKAYELKNESNAFSIEDLKLAVLKLTAQLHKRLRYESVKGMQFETAVQAVSDQHVASTAKIIGSEVCDFDPRNVKAFKATDETVRQILQSLPAGPKTAMIVTTRARYHDESSDDMIHLTVHLYVNRRTRKAVAFYMVEGKI